MTTITPLTSTDAKARPWLLESRVRPALTNGPRSVTVFSGVSISVRVDPTRRWVHQLS